MIPPVIMPWIMIIFFVGGLFAWFSQRWGDLWPRWISMAIMLGHMGLLAALWVQHYTQVELPSGGPWLILYRQPWIPQIGISFSLGMDGISLLLIVLSNLLGIMAVAASWNVIQERVGFFHFNLLWILAALAGIFLALDLFVFYVFWEILLVPLYFLIAIWGYEQRRIYAAVKFFIFTQASGLLMLGFFIAFAVKLPVVPLHTWLPDAHTEAPTAGSVDLAGLVLKIGAYGMFRFVIPLFPAAALGFAPVAMALGIIGILYGALVAFGQTDLKRLVAYSSISHMGFVILGIFAWNQIALQGALLIMLVHGISTGGLFILVGDLYERLHTRDLDRMGGLWSSLSRFGGVGMFLAMASLGLPALGNFVGEFLVLLGVYRVSITFAALGTLGFIVSTVYSLWIMQRAFHGPRKDPEKEGWILYPMTVREASIMALTIAIVIYLGLFPQGELGTARRAFEDLESIRPEEQERPVASQPFQFEIKTNASIPSPASGLDEGGIK
jgi:NADH-quinone oxidoreductase subunit M